MDANGLWQCLMERALATGGFSEPAGGDFRVDATAWALIAQQAAGGDGSTLVTSQERLTERQSPDGGIRIDNIGPDAVWPTALCALAWNDSAKHTKAFRQATAFLLGSKGNTFTKNPGSPNQIDSTLSGWAWVSDTFSWVSPTAMALIALKIAGHTDHPRAREGVRMLLDRQLPGGGWNYGSTLVYGQTMRPQPACTGQALEALNGIVQRQSVRKSLDYLHRTTAATRSPLSLCWGIIGLSAWNERPRHAETWLAQCLKKYPATKLRTTLLASILTSLTAGEGLGTALANARGGKK